jgi:hypothetical protein
MNFFTKTKFLIAVIILLSAIILAIFGTMSYHRFTMSKKEVNSTRDNFQPGRYIAKQLRLTADQIKEFDSLRENFHSESRELSKESNDISKDIMEEIMSESPNIDTLKSLTKKYGKVQEQQKQIMINHLIEIRGKCSTSQQASFKKLMKQIENHERGNRERDRNAEKRGRERN